jgi:hypothetical protein
VNWVRLLEIIEMARRKTGNQPKKDRGWSWACYCPVCVDLRALVVTERIALPEQAS